MTSPYVVAYQLRQYCTPQELGPAKPRSARVCSSFYCWLMPPCRVKQRCEQLRLKVVNLFEKLREAVERLSTSRRKWRTNLYYTCSSWSHFRQTELARTWANQKNENGRKCMKKYSKARVLIYCCENIPKSRTVAAKVCRWFTRLH